MNSKIIRYFACFMLALTDAAFANDSWSFKCTKACASCSSGTCGTPEEHTYDSEATAKKEKEGLEKAGETCSVIQKNSTGNSGTSASTDTSPGLTPLNFKREGLIFEGVNPDYVKYVIVPETVGGVTTNIKKPVQMPTETSTVFYTDLADGSGYQCATYVNSQISPKDANGLRSIPAGAQPVSITIYRHPAGTANTDLTTLDMIHKQRHPQTGAWVTRLVRKFCPQGNNNWTTQFYLGDPAEIIGLQPYREITITRTPNPSNITEESTHEVTRDRDSSGNLVTTSDVSVTYGFYKYGDPVKLAETQHTGTGSELTSTWTYFTAAGDQASFNKPATLRRSDGQWANYTYQGSPVTGILLTKTVSGWLDNAAPAVGTAPDEAANRVVTEIEAKNETGTFSREEKIQGVLVSKTWGERYKDNSGMIIEKSRVETGTATLTTLRTGYPNSTSVPEADRGRVKSIQHPDGTVELHTHALQGDNRVVTIDSGAGSLSALTDGTRTVSTYTKDDTLIKEVISDIASGVVLSTREAIAFDANDQPSRWAYDNDLDDYSETLNGCCGIDSTRTRDGIVTTYTRDDLKRPKTAISQGITLTHTYGKKTIDGTDFPSENVTATAGGLSLDQGTTVYDHAGNVICRITPDLDDKVTQSTIPEFEGSKDEITSITRNFATHTTTTSNPDGGTVVETTYADGQSKATSGNAVAPAAWTYATHGEQGGGLVTTRYAGDPSSTRWTRSYTNLHGEAFKTTAPGDSGEVALQTSVCDAFCRVIKTTDADGVTTLFAYNAEGERYRRAIDLNQNGQIDNADRVTDTIREVVAESSVGPAIKQQSIIYDLSNNPVVVSTVYRSVDGLSSRIETLGSTGATVSTIEPHTSRSDGTWSASTTNPDGTKQLVTYANWLPTSASSLSTDDSALGTRTTTYDALRRSATQTDSRTGLVTTHYAANGQVSSIDDHGRITSFAYDAAGRRIATTLPDGSVTHTSYWPTGQEKAAWGSQTNPTVKIYSPQGELVELRTFRSANLALAPDETTDDRDVTTWIYNNRGQLTRKQYADEKGTNYTYTPGGRLLTRTWARGVTTTYGYDASGQLTTTDYSDATPDVAIAFDKLGRQASVTNGYATSNFAYDPSTLALATETVSYDLNRDGTPELTRVLDRSKDALGRDTGFQLKNGSTIENQAAYQYSATDGRISSISNPQIPNVTFAYAYVPGSSLIANVTGPAHTVTNTWAADRDVLLSKENKAGTTVISEYGYSVNPIGQRIAVSQTGSEFSTATGWNWGYDTLGQVISADSSVNTSDRAYQYDAIGNRIEARNAVTTVTGTPNYAANKLNQYTSVGSVSPLYDDDANMTSGQIPAGSAGLGWDAENRLTTATVVNQDPVHYTYDAQSRRIARSVGTDTTIYLYDAWNVVAEYSSISNSPYQISKSYLWGTDLSGTFQGAGGVGGLLLITDHSAPITSHFPTYDGNGNISEYLDGSGAVSAHFEYDPFGNTVVNTDTENFFNYRFSTKPVDFTTGFYYYGYRYYDPLTGSWPSRDPIEESGGINLYGFVGNNQINRVDALGLENAPTQVPFPFDTITTKLEEIKRKYAQVSKLPDHSDPKVDAATKCPLGSWEYIQAPPGQDIPWRDTFSATIYDFYEVIQEPITDKDLHVENLIYITSSQDLANVKGGYGISGKVTLEKNQWIAFKGDLHIFVPVNVVYRLWRCNCLPKTDGPSFQALYKEYLSAKIGSWDANWRNVEISAGESHYSIGGSVGWGGFDFDPFKSKK